MTGSTLQPPDQLILPRGLIFLAALWFAGSLILAMGLRTPVHATAASLEPGIRLMLQLIAVGLMVGWPLLRLSQASSPMPARQTLLDLLTLLTLLQIIVWVPRVFTVWTVSRTAAIDLMLVSWTVLVGAIVASAIGAAPAPGDSHASGREHPLPRVLAMIASIAITLLGPLLVWIGLPWAEVRSNLIALGPFMGIAHLAEGGATPATRAQWQAIAVIAAAAVLCWGVVGVVAVLRTWRGVRLDGRAR